ncbi:ferrous iron transport protein B [Helicobacter sp. MIT 14-3879]|uniref:ferrous iron transport protein B n=1 Tax=Helicobacter sp. MIT 14-3879 TaxID=2040649 RepID=UPI000E1E95DA|nr:ferrous iron transport protein B [Helicobacter sp. MIT 14-3879]RDU63542.1 ferrous iron transport protein B [Helicobacter sp. MIT 14-3879]
MSKEIIVVLVGQPNVGKTMLINKISGSNLRVGNFTGVTIEKAEAHITYKNYNIRIIDLPGIYSLNEYSQEEKITKKYLQNENYDVILNVADSTNLERNLFLSTQIMTLNKKMLIALNMADEATNDGINIDYKQLSNILGVETLLTSAKSGENVNALLDNIITIYEKPFCSSKRVYADFIEDEIEKISKFIIDKEIDTDNIRELAVKLLSQDNSTYEEMHSNAFWIELNPILQESIKNLYEMSGEKNIRAVFLNDDYAFARGAFSEVCKIKKNNIDSKTSKIDAILLNRYIGIPIFLFFMWLLFNLTFSIGGYPQGWIEGLFAYFGETIKNNISNEAFASLIADGVIGGVGTVLSFLPLILMLFLGIILLESTGYMARVSFMLDGFFHKFGLHGKSFIPLVSGFGCSIPAYMSTRILKNNSDKMITMFIIGFMSCSARLPVYVLFVGAFFDENEAGNILFAIYIFGAIIGLILAKILKLTAFRGVDEPFVMEMPKYRIPSFSIICRSVWNKAYFYVKRAGTFIFIASILIWFGTQYPKNENIIKSYEDKILEQSQDNNLESNKVLNYSSNMIDSKGKSKTIDDLENAMQAELLENSYLGIFGNFISPLFKPLDFDWKLSTALVTGIAAKEVVISTIGVLYSLGDSDENIQSLRDIIKEQVSLPTAIAFVLFVMFYLPCFAATIVFIKESGKSIYGLYLFIFTSIVAYILSFIGYETTKLFI